MGQIQATPHILLCQDPCPQLGPSFNGRPGRQGCGGGVPIGRTSRARWPQSDSFPNAASIALARSLALAPGTWGPSHGWDHNCFLKLSNELNAADMSLDHMLHMPKIYNLHALNAFKLEPLLEFGAPSSTPSG